MTDTEWRRTMHERSLRGLIKGLAVIAGVLAIGIIGIASAAPEMGIQWWGFGTGGLGLVGAILLWNEV